jgi:hypothetical protein
MNPSYRGIKMRSLLETRWASFFDLVGWRWSYEPPLGNGDIPDFLILGKAPMLIEIRPVVLRSEYEREAETMHVNPERWRHDLVVPGLDPRGLVYDGRSGYAGRDEYAALIGQHGDDLWEGWCWDAALWSVCENCGVLGLVHEMQTFYGRPCGCYDGDHFLNYPAGNDRAVQMWTVAVYQTRWEPRQ